MLWPSARKPLGARAGRRQHARRLVRVLGPPLLAFMLARVVLWIAARASGYPYFHYLSWHRFDSGFYVGAATHGYSLLRCVPPHGVGWCGSAGWFPGYSIAIKLLAELGISPRPAALTVSLVFCALTLVVLWAGLLHADPSPRNVLALGFAAFVPGQIYDHTVFPLSMASFFVVLAFVLLDRKRYAAAGVAGGVACATYPTAILIVPVTALWLLIVERSQPRRQWLRRTALTSGLMSLGLGAVLVIDQLQTGHWDAYFKVQAHYHHRLQNPLAAWLGDVEPLRHGIHGVISVPSVEAAFVGLLVLGLTAAVWLHRRTVTSLELLSLLFAIGVWLFPLSLGTVDVYRSDSLLIVAVLLVRRLPIAVATVVTASSAALSAPMAVAFFERVLG